MAAAAEAARGRRGEGGGEAVEGGGARVPDGGDVDDVGGVVEGGAEHALAHDAGADDRECGWGGARSRWFL